MITIFYITEIIQKSYPSMSNEIRSLNKRLRATVHAFLSRPFSYISMVYKKHPFVSKLTIILLLYSVLQFYTNSIAYCDHPAIDSILPDMSEDTRRKNEFVRDYDLQPGRNFIYDYLKEFYPEELPKEDHVNLKKILMIIGGVVLFLLLLYLWYLIDTAPSDEVAKESLDNLSRILEKAVQEHSKRNKP